MPSSHPIYDDFAKRDFHLWLYRNHHPTALHKQFPRYSVYLLYRIYKGHKPKYMPDRVRLTLKGIMDFAYYNKQEAGKLSFYNLAHKYGMTEQAVRRFYQAYKEGFKP